MEVTGEAVNKINCRRAGWKQKKSGTGSKLTAGFIWRRGDLGGILFSRKEMSTLISRLGRRFREKPKSNNLPLPPLPSAREILEDVEGIVGGDPIIRLAVLIQKKGER